MKRLLSIAGVILILIRGTGLLAGDAAALAGTWSVKKVNDEGQSFTQTLKVDKDKFTFRMVGADDQVFLHAEGDLRLEKLGPFNCARFSHIRAGTSPSSLSDTDDEYVSIYVLDSDTWSLVSNFDKQREQQKPSLDVYRKVKITSPAATLVVDEIEMMDTPQSATWFMCFEVKIQGVTRRFHLENKGYDKKQVTIPLGLELPNVAPGQKCGFKVQLDDVDEDACGGEADNLSTGEFSVTSRGSQNFKPQDNWRYTIRWHLK